MKSIIIDRTELELELDSKRRELMMEVMEHQHAIPLCGRPDGSITNG